MTESEKFAAEKADNIRRLRENRGLRKRGLDFISETSIEKYSYNFTWLGRPVIQFPQDLIALQELVWTIQPDLIIETGIAHGGSLIFFASMLELVGNGQVLGIDIDIRAHNRVEIEKHPMQKRIIMIEGSSTDPETADRVKRIVTGKQRVLVCLDSNHSHEHVLRELEIYAPMVSVGSYVVVFDTVVEHMSQELHAGRPWGRGNNPMTAVRAFLERSRDFTIDEDIESKLLITAAPSGYLKRIT